MTCSSSNPFLAESGEASLRRASCQGNTWNSLGGRNRTLGIPVILCVMEEGAGNELEIINTAVVLATLLATLLATWAVVLATLLDPCRKPDRLSSGFIFQNLGHY